jgi:hypothetical protein
VGAVPEEFGMTGLSSVEETGLPSVEETGRGIVALV